jgi:hypothetical protein
MHIHFPEKILEADAAKKRLAFDELLILQLLAYEQKKERLETSNAHSCTISPKKLDTIIKSLPFTLTSDHNRNRGNYKIWRRIPYEQTFGDVGSGKTMLPRRTLRFKIIAIGTFGPNSRRTTLPSLTSFLVQCVDIRLMTGNTKDRIKPSLGTHACSQRCAL